MSAQVALDAKNIFISTLSAAYMGFYTRKMDADVGEAYWAKCSRKVGLELEVLHGVIDDLVSNADKKTEYRYFPSSDAIADAWALRSKSIRDHRLQNNGARRIGVQEGLNNCGSFPDSQWQPTASAEHRQRVRETQDFNRELASLAARGEITYAEFFEKITKNIGNGR